jgi:hypothetical protein
MKTGLFVFCILLMSACASGLSEQDEVDISVFAFQVEGASLLEEEPALTGRMVRLINSKPCASYQPSSKDDPEGGTVVEVMEQEAGLASSYAPKTASRLTKALDKAPSC